jgi:DNA (cytosine-5)-methyltransferase 1
MKIGSLCTGYGGLDMAVEAYFDAETVWVSEIDKHASAIIKKRFALPNLGDLKMIDWDNVEPIDILTAGYPCQPFSVAGNRKGKEDERHLWPYIKKSISILRPRIVILENVSGHLSLGFDQVLADLTEIGYDARWQIVRASDVGAPHRRARLFIIAYPQSERSGRQTNAISWEVSKLGGDISFASNTDSDAHTQPRRADRGISKEGERLRNGKDQGKAGNQYRRRTEMAQQELPNTLDGLGRLNPLFVEYMMGLPIGWVTDCGLARTNQLKILGNGVVPQQAFHAISLMMDTEANYA